jgi:hypothetical protein
MGREGGAFKRGASSTSKQAGQISASYKRGTGTIVSGATANKATKAAVAAYPGGIVDRVVKLSNGEYEAASVLAEGRGVLGRDEKRSSWRGRRDLCLSLPKWESPSVQVKSIVALPLTKMMLGDFDVLKGRGVDSQRCGKTICLVQSRR